MNKEYLLYKLSLSKFRNSFKLSEKDIEYINRVGLEKIKEHAYDFINNRLKDVSKINDGKQTPMRGHPVFIAQHATATCCRNCVYKWYHIDKNKILTDKEIDFIVEIIMEWIIKKYNESM